MANSKGENSEEKGLCVMWHSGARFLAKRCLAALTQCREGMATLAAFLREARFGVLQGRKMCLNVIFP